MTDRKHYMVDCGEFVYNELCRLKVAAESHCNGVDLDQTTALWLLTEAAYISFVRPRARMLLICTMDETNLRPVKILGLPYRITTRDDPDTPLVQLVMEPTARKRSLL